jgi:hypothetical protein
MQDQTNVCWSCKKDPIEYRPLNCNCEIYCKKCAMKFATGGKCKSCH